MKKIIVLIVVFAFCLSLSACGKSEAVKNVEAMIDALGEITLESIDAIRAAEEAYAILTSEEQGEVKNYESLTAARDRYYEFALVGNWHDTYIWVKDVMENYERPPYLVLNADMTGVEYGDGGIEDAITWSVKNRNLEFTFESGNTLSFPVLDENGKISLDGFTNLLKEDDYFAYLDQIFLIVDVEQNNVNDYFGFEIYDYEYVDEWNEPTGTHFVRAILTNELYDQGWLYLETSNDFAIEVCYPQFSGYITYEDGRISNFDWDEGSFTLIAGYPFNFDEGLYVASYKTGSKITHDLTIDELSFGRTRGTIVFINSNYVSEVKLCEDGYSRVLTTDFSGEQEIYSGYWYNGINY